MVCGILTWVDPRCLSGGPRPGCTPKPSYRVSFLSASPLPDRSKRARIYSNARASLTLAASKAVGGVL